MPHYYEFLWVLLPLRGNPIRFYRGKIQIKSEKLTPFGGIFSIMEQFDALLAQTIDSTLGLVALWGKGILCLRRFCYAQGICTIKEFLSFYK